MTKKNNSTKTDVKYRGLSFLGTIVALLTVALVIVKLIGAASLTWFQVFIPMLLYISIVPCLIITAVVLAFLFAIIPIMLGSISIIWRGKDVR